VVVCHLIASGFAGGPEKQIIEQSTRLAEFGWSVVVGSFRENRSSVELVDNAKQRNIPTFLIDTKSPFSPAAVFQLKRALRRFHVDLLVTHGYKPTIVGHLARAGSRVVQVPMVRGYTAEDWKVRIYEAIDRWFLKRFRMVICVSAATAKLMAGYGVKPDRIKVIHNAVNCEGDVTPADLHKEFDIPSRFQVIVAAGRLSPEKGHRYLVDAVKILVDSGFPVCLLLLGAGKELPRLERQVAEANLGEHVVFGGFRKPILPYLAGADLVVNPSETEGLPNVVLEALSVRTPVVATDVGGVGEIITSGKTGWLVPPAQIQSLADAIKHAIENPFKASAVIENGYKLIKDSFSFSYQVAQFADLYSNLIRLSGPSSVDGVELRRKVKS